MWLRIRTPRCKLVLVNNCIYLPNKQDGTQSLHHHPWEIKYPPRNLFDFIIIANHITSISQENLESSPADHMLVWRKVMDMELCEIFYVVKPIKDLEPLKAQMHMITSLSKEGLMHGIGVSFCSWYRTQCSFNSGNMFLVFWREIIPEIYKDQEKSDKNKSRNKG